jgi:hypothetical protein
MILFIVLACPGHPASLTGAGMFLVSSFNIPERVLIYGWMDRSGLAFRIFSAWLGCERRQVSSYFSCRLLFLSLFHEERDNGDGERCQGYRKTNTSPESLRDSERLACYTSVVL